VPSLSILISSTLPPPYFLQSQSTVGIKHYIQHFHVIPVIRFSLLLISCYFWKQITGIFNPMYNLALGGYRITSRNNHIILCTYNNGFPNTGTTSNSTIPTQTLPTSLHLGHSTSDYMYYFLWHPPP